MMSTGKVTELVFFKAREGSREQDIISLTNGLNCFQKEQDGFLNAELVKQTEQGGWCLIYHFDDMEKVKALGPVLRASKAFADFSGIIEPGSLKISFYLVAGLW